MRKDSETQHNSRNDRFVRLLTQCDRRVYSFILSMVPNLADADEIHQQTNINLWRDFDKFVAGTDFCAWAISVARFQIMTYRKTKGRNRLFFTDEVLEAMASEAADLSTDERHQALVHCLETLPPRSRDLVAAYYAHDADRAMVAAKLGRSVNALHNALSRIRRALRDCVERRLKGATG